MLKNSSYVCPKCGSNDLEVYDDEYYDDMLIHKCACYNCDETWREYFKLKYDGYSYNGKDYDEKGKEI